MLFQARASESTDPNGIQRRTAWVLFGLGLLLSLARAPSLLLHPRLLAEEGTVYFRFALEHPFAETFAAAHLGYYSLIPNVATFVGARLTPLAWAPAVTGVFAFGIQLVPIALIASMSWGSWSHPSRRLACIFVVILNPLGGPLWLSTINSQYFLAVAASVLLLEPLSGGAGPRVGRDVLLPALCGLSSPQACFLLPVFAGRALIARSERAWCQTAILAAATLVQGSAALASGLGHRLATCSPAELLTVLAAKTVVWPALGYRTAVVGVKLAVSGLAGGILSKGTAYAVLLALLGGTLWWAVRCVEPKSTRWLLCASYLVLGVLSFWTALGPRADLLSPASGQRYFFASAVVLLLGAASRLPVSRQGAGSLGAFAALLVFLAVTIQGITASRYYTKDSWPPWREEIERWQQDPRYEPRIWPERWRIPMGPPRR